MLDPSRMTAAMSDGLVWYTRKYWLQSFSEFSLFNILDDLSFGIAPLGFPGTASLWLRLRHRQNPTRRYPTVR